MVWVYKSAAGLQVQPKKRKAGAKKKQQEEPEEPESVELIGESTL